LENVQYRPAIYLVEPEPTASPPESEKAEAFPKLTAFFDSADYIAQRIDHFVSIGKPAAINLFLMLHLLIDLIVVLVVLLRGVG
jgi:hypothetical protein